MRKVWDIHGGVHPPENKTQSNQLAITSAGIPDQLVFPLSQHIGAPAAPIVEIGQKVLKGEMIAEAKGFVSVPVHASTSGEVIAIEQRNIPHPSGMAAPCIIIQADGKDEWIDHSGLEDYTAVDKKELLNRIREAGIAGMGGAGFPSAVKLGTRDDQVIETLIINGTECEPYITADDMLMRERAEEIIAGAKILKYLIKPTKEAIIGVEDNKPEGIAALEKAAEGSGIEVVSFPTKYPSGGEKQLIQILTGKEVPSGGLPAQVGIVCQNLGTTVAIYRAIQLGEPLISRITTVTGEACEQNRNYEVLLGSPISHLLELAGYQQKKASRLIMGGPMMGFTLNSETVPVVKTTNCILAPSKKEIPPPTPAQACIRCGMCAEACPVSLLPQQMYWFARGKEYEKLEAHNLMDCIECGACSFACPSNIPLVQYYRASKADIRQQKEDAIKAEQSKARFEARQERIERQEAEKEAKRKARKAAAEARAAGNADAGKVDAVQAAVERAKAKKAAVDPAQAAIEKAKAKRAGGAEEAPTKESLEKALASVEKRLAAAKEKLQQAEQEGSDKVDAFRTGVEKTEAKYQAAKTALDTFIADNPAPEASTDPAQLAIQRAQEKRASKADLSPREKAQQAVDSLKTRIEKAQVKLEAAKAEDSDKLDIFEKTLAGLQEKLAKAEQELAEIPAEKAAEPAPSGDAAQDAIARALAKREAASSMTDEERLLNAVEALGKRLDKTRDKLATAQAEGSDTVDILTETLAKLDLKLVDAKQAYDDYKQNN
ncbi:electron transport complex subunit RsxC [Oceanicoccus sagamiensis]|uniref:Ion-translocating oxidoreductase complex subunit C n=1 Tax=Oceanicoccus sagamiensis TaxID=716816 RepID=A0A1X9NDB4_9GAMM|nr:electron transport complex subunit RsxC [Oceanicoccus sagamiensis]ARN75044.1 electron transport complex subunit RsxC [Oceanicoccus sagamiensis]